MTADGSAAVGGKSAVTMRQVAALARVDQSVVSRMLNDDPRLSISPATRERVWAAIRELNYRPNAAARALRTSKSRLVAVLLPDLTNPVYAQLLQSIQERASGVGYGVAMAAVQQLVNSDSDSSDLLGRVDGVLVAAGTLPRSTLRAIVGGPVPTVLINRSMKDAACTVSLNNRAGSEVAADHLLDLGHRDVVVFAESTTDTAGGVRFRAFKQRFEAAGGRATAVRTPGLNARDGFDAMGRVLQAGTSATAVFAVNFMLGIGALRAAHEHQLRVPDELSLIAVHDSSLAEFTIPAMTTVAMPMVEAGVVAFDALVRIINGHELGTYKVETPPRLIVRESTASPRAGAGRRVSRHTID